jgi:hypothetical protein
MITRAPAHAQEEKAIFDAFLTAHPSFAAQIKDVEQPDAQFPDLVVTTTTGPTTDFELGEWLDGTQMGAAKRYERLEQAMFDAIGPQGPNPSPHFRAVMLSPCEDAAKFDPSDQASFRTELWGLVAATHHFWPTERFWHSPQGRVCREFADYPTIRKYLRSVRFDPLVVRGAPRPWPEGRPWIFVELRGGSYSPETALAALRGILAQKINHYGRFSRPTRLIIYYGKAIVYNTPYLGVETRAFADVAAQAAAVVAGQTAFEKIYLLNALEPGLEAYEISPSCTQCT